MRVERSPKMSMAYIRKTYGVPAKRGMRVEYEGHPDSCRYGYITGSRGPWLLIKFGKSPRSKIYHPTWNLKYLPEVVDKIA